MAPPSIPRKPQKPVLAWTALGIQTTLIVGFCLFTPLLQRYGEDLEAVAVQARGLAVYGAWPATVILIFLSFVAREEPRIWSMAALSICLGMAAIPVMRFLGQA